MRATAQDTTPRFALLARRMGAIISRRRIDVIPLGILEPHQPVERMVAFLDDAWVEALHAAALNRSYRDKRPFPRGPARGSISQSQ